MSDQYFQNIPVSIETLPAVEEHTFTPISRKYAQVLYLTNSLYMLMILFALGIFIMVQLGFFHWITYAILLGWLLLYLFTLWFASASTDRKSYLLRWHDISYREGVFFHSWITIPFSRVQHCEITKGVIDNLFGLVELRIFTAGGSSSDIVIPGLRPDDAFRLKEQIIGKILEHDEEE
ncbi:MAG: PH domain-containing protein [Saprospiraceae bacterium]|nr:PH domain-containing protein [Saprospiraceae bacterium]